MLRRLMDKLRPGRTGDQPADAPAHRDYTQEREDHRHAQMSDEDQAWGAASQQRDREKREQDQPPPVQ